MPVKKELHFRQALKAISEGSEGGQEEAAEEALDRIEVGFATGRDALGKPWAPLSPETIRQKGHSRILIDTGDLSESGFIKTTSSGTVIVGLDSDLAPIHEYGTQDIPRRPILQPALTWMAKKVRDPVADEIADEIRKRGFRFKRSALSR